MELHPSFHHAVTSRSAQANAKVLRRFYRRACGFTVETEKVFYDSRRGKVVRAKTKEYYPPSETAAIFWLKNREPEYWKDRHELTGKDGAKLAADIYNVLNVTISSEEAIDAYDKLLQIEAKAISFKDKVT
jgi:hypothetical protein